MHGTFDRPSTPIAAITAAFALALAVWVVWLLAHALALALHGSTAGYALVGALAVAVLLVASALVGRLAGRAGGWRVGALGGLIAGLLTLLLLGSKVVEQPATTDEMAQAANRLRPDAAVVVLGFLGVCTAVALVGGLIGSRTAPADRPMPGRGRTLAWMGALTAIAMLPLLILGGFVTGTGSGLAVPDGVTSYGAFSALFPLSLMSEPRIFLEHSHRLFGTLVGLSAIALMVVALVLHRRGRWLGVGIGLVLLVAAAGAMGAGHAGSLSESASAGLMALVGLLALGFTHAMLGRGFAGAACVGVFVLVSIQGLLGIARVDEQLVWVAAFHGAFAQFVFATACMAAALLTPLASAIPPLEEATAATVRPARKLAAITVVVTSIQIVFGALTRHFDSMHSLLTHAVFSLVVVVLAVMLGFRLRRAGADPLGRALARCGTLVLVLIFAQFLLGWVALVATQMGGPRITPTADALHTAGPIPLGEAIATTAHQTGGALLLGGICLALFWARRGVRALAAPPAAESR